MIDATSVAAVDASRLPSGGVRPLHEGWTFAALPATVERLLTGEHARGPALPATWLPARSQRVLLVLLDGLGWHLLMRHADHPLLRRIERDGAIAKLTTQFPATTTAHVTTLHTGRPVGDHGLYEWNLLEPSLDAIVTPLLFSFAGDPGRDTLRLAGVEPRALLPTDTLYARLAARGVACVAVQPGAFTPSTYDGVLLRGADVVPYAAPADGVEAAAQRLRAVRGRAYGYVYWDGVDLASHRYGPWSDEVAAAAQAGLDAVEAALALVPPGTLVLIAADHGQVAVDPATTVFVNLAWPEITGLLRRGARGRVLAPAGSARDLFLHARPNAVDELIGGLRRVLGERAEVHAVSDMLADGLFGPAPGERLRARLGDVCVLPAAGETVWWRERGRFGMPFRGHHGGLHREEAETVVAALPL